MTQIGNVPQINQVKLKLRSLQAQGLVSEWEIPYENILTRLTAAIFFLTPANEASLSEIWEELKTFPMLQYCLNEEKVISSLQWRVEFNKGFQL